MSHPLANATPKSIIYAACAGLLVAAPPAASFAYEGSCSFSSLVFYAFSIWPLPLAAFCFLCSLERFPHAMPNQNERCGARAHESDNDARRPAPSAAASFLFFAAACYFIALSDSSESRFSCCFCSDKDRAAATASAAAARRETFGDPRAVLNQMLTLGALRIPMLYPGPR